MGKEELYDPNINKGYSSPAPMNGSNSAINCEIPCGNDSPPSCRRPTDDCVHSVGFSFHGSWGKMFYPCSDTWNPCALLNEFFGAGFLIFCISMAAICACSLEGQVGWKIGSLFVGLVATFVSFLLIAGFGHISGGHYNSGVTLLQLILGNISPISALLYVLMHFLGSIVAGACLLIYYDSYHCCLGATQVGDGVSLCTAIITEIFGSCVLFAVVVYSQECKSYLHPSFAISATLGLLHFLFLDFTGAAFNFWRYLGPAIFSCCFDYWWVYLISPLIAVIIVVVCYKLCHYLSCYFDSTKKPRSSYTKFTC